jgi:beta-galactosidase
MPCCSSLNRDWQFLRCPAGATERTALEHALRAAADAWQSIELPHTPFTPDLDGRNHWLGICVYRRVVHVPGARALISGGAQVAVHFGAAMHTAHVWIDQELLTTHVGGYLPFQVDLTSHVADEQPHTLFVVLDNRDNPDVPPGKPYSELDFCWYGGLYRGAELRIYPPVHVTDAVAAGVPGGGGVLFQTIEATQTKAVASVQVHVRNTSPLPQEISVAATLRMEGKQVSRGHAHMHLLECGGSHHFKVELDVQQPALWSVESPALHELEILVLDRNGCPLDQHAERCGLRRIRFSRSHGFELNGRRIRPRGTNRHQEYPYCGYAVPAAAQRRDAQRIKEAGFDYVRLAHYPQAPEFLDACDELGIVVMNPIPGWQFMGGEAFRAACKQHARDLIRRDRNHPSVVLWELSLNETLMDEAFMAELHRIGHEELPGDQMYTCGWIDRYDVFIHSRQHGELHRWRNGDKAIIVAEYGDWEFFASNHGFDQKTGAGLFAPWSHGRHLRGGGERGLRQQAWNHMLALNDTMSSPAALDGQWCIFDYARGYDANRAACGIADVFRLPKFSWHFYRSQRHPTENGGTSWRGGPMVFIASHWTPASELRVLVFSNCNEVELRLNGTPLGRQRPAFTWMTQFLPHPPFVFDLPCFAPGKLEATGFLHGQAVASHAVATPSEPAQLKLQMEQSAFAPTTANAGDVLLAYLEVCDADGLLCVEASPRVTFQLNNGSGAIVLGPTITQVEAGIASVVIRLFSDTERFQLVGRVLDGPLAGAEAALSWERQVASRGQPDSALAQYSHRQSRLTPL